MSSNRQYAQELSLLQADWTYQAEQLPLRCWARYIWQLRQLRFAPESREILPITQHRRWFVYFMFLPDGLLGSHHRFTLEKLKSLDGNLLVVCATRTPSGIPESLPAMCDALYWKSLEGYDFSAYSIALHAIASYSPGADVLVMNDSVFGPFVDLNHVMADLPWDLTGFTASNAASQRHIQSYAFAMTNVGPARLAGLSQVFPTRFAFRNSVGAVACQELWLARAASRQLSVGAFWYGEDDIVHDPSLTQALALYDGGFPYLKRSLLGKHSSFQNKSDVLDRLNEAEHLLP